MRPEAEHTLDRKSKPSPRRRRGRKGRREERNDRKEGGGKRKDRGRERGDFSSSVFSRIHSAGQGLKPAAAAIGSSRSS